MQLMNGFTVLILTGVLHLIMGGAGLLIRVQDETRPAVRLWLWAQLIAGSAQLLRLVHNTLPVFWSSTLPNSGMALAYGMMLIALARLFGLPQRALLVSTALLVFANLLLRSLGLPEPERLSLLSVLTAIQFGQFIYLFSQAYRQQPSALICALQFGNLLVVLTLLTRTMEAAGAGDGYDFLHAGIGQTLALFGLFAGITMNGFGFLILLIERGVSELARLSTLDSLTETLTRRSVLQYGRQQLALADRAAHPFSVLICDIDHFKHINDRFGHHAGDDVIRALVRVARASLRESDQIGRWGGEEFVLLLPRTPLAGAVQLAERLRVAFAARPVPYDKQTLYASISIGVAEHRLSEDLQHAIDRADQALLRAKQSGRNRVEIASD